MAFNPSFITNSNANTNFIAKEKDLKIKISETKKEYENCLSIHDNLNPKTELYFLDSIDLLKRKHNDLVRSNLSEIPIKAKIASSNLQLKKAQNLLLKDEAILSYFDGYSDKFLYSTIITKENFFSFKKPTSSTIKKLIGSYINAIADIELSSQNFEESKQNFSRMSIDLYQYLLEDELSNISADVNQLHIISDWMLESFPFKVLLTEAPDSSLSYKAMPYLLRKYATSYEYSLQSFLENRQKKRKVRKNNYVGISPDYEPLNESEKEELIAYVSKTKPDFAQFILRDGYVNLPGAKQGVIDIANQIDRAIAITGDEASKETLINYLNNSNIVHISTHGVIEKEKTEFSQLVFSAQNEDENLFAYELFDIDVNTELVMLSACDTGRGVIRSGKNLQSISQAFSLAGASSLTISLFNLKFQTNKQLLLTKNSYIRSTMGKGLTNR